MRRRRSELLSPASVSTARKKRDSSEFILPVLLVIPVGCPPKSGQDHRKKFRAVPFLRYRFYGRAVLFLEAHFEQKWRRLINNRPRGYSAGLADCSIFVSRSSSVRFSRRGVSETK